MVHTITNKPFKYERKKPPFCFSEPDSPEGNLDEVWVHSVHKEYYNGLRENSKTGHRSVLKNGMTYGEYSMLILSKG